MPLPALLLSLLGLAPFIGCGLESLASNAAGGWLAAFIGYAALVLTFAGGVHWGLVLREPQPPLTGARIGLAVVPLLLAWLALVAASTVREWLGLAILIVGYILTIAAEHQGGRQGLLPPRYLWLRWIFTVVAVAMLTTVLTLRLLGQTIAF